ncbi:hypothetical protein NFI96_013698, partial [Prochilodus magdalenae]
TPYGRPQNRRDSRRGGGGGEGGGEDGNHNRGRGGRGGGGGGGGSIGGDGGGGGGRKNWFKITIPHGKKYEKQWLLSALQSQCTMPFHAIQYHTDGNRVVFYIDDSTTANALVKVSRKITGKDGYKVAILMNTCPPPSLIHQDLKPEDLEHLKQCMSKRFDGAHQALDLNNIRVDPDLVPHIDVALNRKNSMQAVIKIIEENIPELVCLNLSNNRLYKLDDLAEIVNKVRNLKILNLSFNELKSERELDKLKGLKLVELSLEKNPLCDHFKDQADYISAIRERFPRLLKLVGHTHISALSECALMLPLLVADGHDLPPPIGFDLEVAPPVLPPCKPSYFCSKEIKTLIQCFLQQYYTIYDSADRQPLLDAYHDGASFSLTIPFTTQNPSKCSLGEYQKDSRNMKRVRDSMDGKSRDSYRSFSRVFITVAPGNGTLCIVNDELFIRNATTEEIRRAFVALAPTPSSSPVPTLSAIQQEMLSAFSQKSGMNLEWSQKCLQDNDWDFNRAAQIFTDLKAQGKIPDVAFVK